jgi:hypothetical protein
VIPDRISISADDTLTLPNPNINKINTIREQFKITDKDFSVVEYAVRFSSSNPHINVWDNNNELNHKRKKVQIPDMKNILEDRPSASMFFDKLSNKSTDVKSTITNIQKLISLLNKE